MQQGLRQNRERENIDPVMWKEAKKLLSNWGQEAFANTIQKNSKPELLRQILDIDQKLPMQLLGAKELPKLPAIPTDRVAVASEEEIWRGGECIRRGETACILVAGGQGSRFQSEEPKGQTAVSPIQRKSLFQLFAERVHFAGKLYGRKLPVAVMTSPSNHANTQLFFVENQFFGLDPAQIDFCAQPLWPLFNLRGELFFDEADHIAMGPNGNGAVFSTLVEKGIWEKWRDRGVKYASFVQVDNALADPFDPKLFGRQAKTSSDVVVKVIDRKDPDEKVGVVVDTEKGIRIYEYSELPESARGDLDRFSYANISLFSFSISLIQKAARLDLPLHRAKKAVPIDGVYPVQPNAQKFEWFVFDAFEAASSIQLLPGAREDWFAPLKNLHGPDSMESVQKALQAADRRTFEKITGEKLPSDCPPFELSMDFHYPTQELQEAWKGKKKPPRSYLEIHSGLAT